MTQKTLYQAVQEKKLEVARATGVSINMISVKVRRDRQTKEVADLEPSVVRAGILLKAGEKGLKSIEFEFVRDPDLKIPGTVVKSTTRFYPDIKKAGQIARIICAVGPYISKEVCDKLMEQALTDRIYVDYAHASQEDESIPKDNAYELERAVTSAGRRALSLATACGYEVGDDAVVDGEEPPSPEDEDLTDTTGSESKEEEAAAIRDSILMGIERVGWDRYLETSPYEKKEFTDFLQGITDIAQLREILTEIQDMVANDANERGKSDADEISGSGDDKVPGKEG